MSISTICQRTNEQGMNTAEYAVGTVGAAGIGGILYKLVTSGFFQDFMTGVLDKITDVLPF